jgi:hypothetical protein
MKPAIAGLWAACGQSGGGGRVSVSKGVSLSASSWLPARPRLSAGTSLFQKSKYFLDALRVGEELGERARPAVGCEVPSACGCVLRAFCEHVLNCLKGLATGARDLFLGV